MKKVLLIDGFGIIFKSYYAFINRPLINKNGENTSAIFGFFKSLIATLKREKPDYYVVALEGEGKCFRNDIYPEYKANRPPAPDDLKSQIPKIIELLDKLDIPHLSEGGFEADDIIGTIAEKFSTEVDKEALILSSDKDLRQLVNDKIKICHPSRFSDDYDKLDENDIKDKMGVKPSQVIDYLALAGDSSDNILGVRGVGPKTAVQLLNDWNDLDNIYKNIEKIDSKSVKEKLKSNKDSAYLSKDLATIDRQVPMDLNWDELSNKPLNIENAKTLLAKDNLDSVINSINEYNLLNFDKKEIPIQPKIIETEPPVNESELSTLKREYGFVPEINDLEKKIEKIKRNGNFCFDLETTGFDFLSDKIICISIASNDDVFLIPIFLSIFQQKELNIMIDEKFINTIKDKLKIIFEDKNILKIGHNIKFDIKFLKRFGIEVKGNLFDTMIAEYCLDAANNILGMDILAEKYLNYRTIHYKDIIDDPKKETLQDIPVNKLASYAGEDADITYRLYKILKQKIEKDKKKESLFYDIEIPLLNILINMEYFGVYIDTDYLKDLSFHLEKEINDISKRLIEIAEIEFNPNSPKQIAEILFEKFKLPIIKKTKTGPSTDMDVLKKLSYLHPIASILLEYRTLSKIKSTYSDSLPQMINKVSGKIHTTFLQTGTQTGRLASKNPNLQNIPVKTNIGRKIRQAFIPSKGNILISADYSQIELFLLAEFSKDSNLFEAFNTGEDVHLKTSSLIFNKKMEDVSKKERIIGKTINFSILYGQGPHRLSEALEISRKDAADFISLYFTNYSGIGKYMEDIKENCKKTGYAETHWGRKRTIPEIHDRNKMRQANGERMAVNTTIQGTAADLIKISMIKIAERFKQENIRSRLIIQVHDELIFDVVKDEKIKVINIVKESMENGFDFKLKLKTSIQSGNNWGELK